MTDKNTIQLIEKMSGKLEALNVKTAENSLLIKIVIGVVGAILLAILPAFGFLIAFWVQHGK